MTSSKKRKQEPEHDQPSKSKKPGASHAGGSLNSRDGKNALINYILEPERFSSDIVLYYDESFVAINDAFPKGAVHTLLLPRNLDLAQKHPIEALQDPKTLKLFRDEVSKLKRLAASELRRKFGRFSAKERERIEAMDADPPPEELPAGRNWEDELQVGIHAGPSMNHLHVHVMSKEYMGLKGKTGRHYQTFKTKFFVNLDEFPLAEGDDRLRGHGLKEHLAQDLRCWRCGKNFKRSWVTLEAHLREEFEVWKAE